MPPPQSGRLYGPATGDAFGTARRREIITPTTESTYNRRAGMRRISLGNQLPPDRCPGVPLVYHPASVKGRRIRQGLPSARPLLPLPRQVPVALHCPVAEKWCISLSYKNSGTRAIRVCKTQSMPIARANLRLGSIAGIGQSGCAQPRTP